MLKLDIDKAVVPRGGLAILVAFERLGRCMGLISETWDGKKHYCVMNSVSYISYGVWRAR